MLLVNILISTLSFSLIFLVHKFCDQELKDILVPIIFMATIIIFYTCKKTRRRHSIWHSIWYKH